MVSQTSELFGEQLAFEALGAASIEDHCLTLRGELQGLRSAIESRRQRRASLVGSDGASRRASRQMLDASQQQALEQQELRAELVQDFEKRLADMHVQLLAKQHEFEQYRQTMEHDLKQQLRYAQPHLVSQLVDKSGAMSVETKTTFLESLHGQVEVERLQKENVRFKHTILKLQTLHDMQRQIREVESEKERAIQKAQRLRATQVLNENTALQQRVKQLESEMAKVTQDRTVFQLKYAELQKQHELAAQRRREAKVRALSAPYRRRLDGVDEPRDESRSSGRERDAHVWDYERDEEAFEQLNEVRIRSPRRGESDSTHTGGDDKREREQHLENATRHYHNEIKRLQQQLAREIKLKAQLLDQVTQLKAGAVGVDDKASELRPEEPSSVQKPPRSGLRAASPRVALRAASASVWSPRKAQAAVMAPRRPSTSFSPRGQRRQAAGAKEVSVSTSNSDSRPSDQNSILPQPGSPTPSRSVTPQRSASASAPSVRKFEVHEREPPVIKVGGVAGVQNALSARERLPYR